MPKKKLTVREKREAQKKERLAKLAEKNNSNVRVTIATPEITDEELQEIAKIIDKKPDVRSVDYEKDVSMLKNSKNDLQRQLDSFADPEILDIPEFLMDSSKDEERTQIFEKIKYLLKHRFSLVAIADVLETNDYDRLDDIIENKDRVYKLVEEYTSGEDSPEQVRLYSKFKKVVGDEYSRTYSEQEERVKAAVTILGNGKYLKKGMSTEKVTEAVEDIVSSVIDGADFNLACQIETEFVNYELNRTIEILSDLQSRAELQELIEELKSTSRNIEERSHAYSVMDMLISGKKSPRKIIDLSDSESDERGGR